MDARAHTHKHFFTAQVVGALPPDPARDQRHQQVPLCNMCIHVCICVYMCKCTPIYMFVCMCIPCIRVPICTCRPCKRPTPPTGSLVQNVCRCVYMCVYVYMCKCTPMYMCICVCGPVRICVPICTCRPSRRPTPPTGFIMYLWVCAYIFVCVHMRTHITVHTRAHTRTHTYT